MSLEEKPPVNAIITGGQELPIQFNDGTAGTVKVRLIPLSQVAKYLDVVGDLNGLVALVCDQKPEWVDSLTDDSIFAIDELARKLNDPRIDRYLARQQSAVPQMMAMGAKVADLTKSLRTQ